ncbi:MAG: hypothetical protein ACRYG5_02390 [Janthinobacterium lividum]
MKRTFMLLAAGILTLAFAACSAVPAAKMTPAQFVAVACPPVKQALALAPIVGASLSATALSDVGKATPIVDAACASGATVSTATVSQFAATVLPAASAVISAAPASVLSDDQKTKIQDAIVVAELAVATVTAVTQNAEAATAVSGEAPTAGSAPAAAPPVPASGLLVASL